ncbi:MAG: DMT family transporter [Paracoccaceae bacterium]
MTPDRTRLGIALVTLGVALFAVQDGFSRHLAATYNTLMVVTIRYWFFAAFVLLIALRRPGGLRSMATARPGLHTLRASLLIVEICIIVLGFTMIGLIESHAVFAFCPLLVAALAGPVLGERVGWRRWSAIAIGFTGVLIILKPGSAVFSPAALLPLAAAAMYALYSLLTRIAAKDEGSLVSLFWAGLIGAALITPLGLWHWQPMAAFDWALMAAYGVIAAVATGLVIRAYELAEASALQPFIYLQLVFVALIGFTVFGEVLRPNVAIGAGVVVASGIFTLIRTRRVGGTTGTPA